MGGECGIEMDILGYQSDFHAPYSLFVFKGFCRLEIVTV